MTDFEDTGRAHIEGPLSLEAHESKEKRYEQLDLRLRTQRRAPVSGGATKPRQEHDAPFEHEHRGDGTVASGGGRPPPKSSRSTSRRCSRAKERLTRFPTIPLHPPEESAHLQKSNHCGSSMLLMIADPARRIPRCRSGSIISTPQCYFTIKYYDVRVLVVALLHRHRYHYSRLAAGCSSELVPTGE
jgi:hypothetical protein